MLLFLFFLFLLFLLLFLLFLLIPFIFFLLLFVITFTSRVSFSLFLSTYSFTCPPSPCLLSLLSHLICSVVFIFSCLFCVRFVPYFLILPRLTLISVCNYVLPVRLPVVSVYLHFTCQWVTFYLFSASPCLSLNYILRALIIPLISLLPWRLLSLLIICSTLFS